MAIGVVGRKAGMTRIFTDDGVSVPVTVIEVQPNRVTQVRTVEKEGYSAIQVTIGEKKASRLNQPETGHFAKAGVEAGRGLWEFRLDDHLGDAPTVGASVDVGLFEIGQKIDVRGMSKGKGFQGGVKRHNFRMQDASHGNSLSHRAPGSIGQCQTPGRVFKGKKMAGHMGSAKVCSQSLEVARIDAERNLLLVKGAVPGARGGDVVITPAIKLKNKR
jgi:large subunit ribosomal protein L3